LRELEVSAAYKDAQIEQALYHLRRINGSPWWRLGKYPEKLIFSPHRFIATFMARNKAAAGNFSVSIHYTRNGSNSTTRFPTAIVGRSKIIFVRLTTIR
jgi:hypothetical protein